MNMSRTILQCPLCLRSLTACKCPLNKPSSPLNIRVFAYCTHTFTPVTDVTLPHLRRYCARHGYILVFHEVPYRTDRPLGFLVTEAAMRELRECDALLVIGLDVLITNDAIRVESLMDDKHDMFVTHDHNGLNLGAYIVRKEGWRLLQEMMDREGGFNVTSEQDAARDMMRQFEFLRDCVKVLPQRAMNSYLYTEYPETRGADELGHWQPGDFVLHLPGRSSERRVEIFNAILKGEYQRQVVQGGSLAS